MSRQDTPFSWSGRSPTTRRKFLIGAGVTSVAGLAGCISDGNQTGGGEYSGQTLKVTAYGGVYAEMFNKYVKPQFEEETGATLQVIEGASGLLSKIKAAPNDDPPYDVTIAEGFYYFSGRQDDLFEEVRYENVPNMDQVYPYLKNQRTMKYGTPSTGSPMAIIYRKDIGWDPLEWTDLVSDRAENISVDGGFFIYPYMAAAIVSDTKPSIDELYDESTYEDVFNVLESMDIVSFQGDGSNEVMLQQLRQGTSDIAQWYYSNSHRNIQEDEELDISLPENNASYINMYCPVRGTQNRRLAEEFINFTISEETQNRWAESGSVMVNRNVEYPDYLQDIYPTSNEEFNNIAFPNWDIVGPKMNAFLDHFKKLKSGN